MELAAYDPVRVDCISPLSLEYSELEREPPTRPWWLWWRRQVDLTRCRTCGAV